MARLEIYLFGSPRIYLDQQPIDVDTRKAIALLGYLAVVNIPVGRGQIIDLLWADYDERRARASLRRTLSVLRKALDQDWLAVEDETLALRPSPDLFVDVRTFHNELKRLKKHQGTIIPADISALEQAVNLYHADFLAGFALRDSSPFEEWARTEAQRLHREMLDALAIITQWHSAYENFDAMVRIAERWRQISPFEDKSIFYLMQAHAALGNRSRAIQIFEAFEALLRKEMQIQPMSETQTLYMQLLDGDDLTEGTFHIAPNSRAIFRVPPILRPFVGRARELQYLTQLLRDDHCRLITLLAMGGMGKTSLALQLAHQTKSLFLFGIVYATLDGPTPESGLISLIAAALDLQFHDRDSNRDQLLSFLTTKSVLLLLDNFEHYTDGSQFILDLIYRTTAKVIVISQKPLMVREEWQVHLRGLDLPAVDSDESTLQAAACRLLIESVQRLHWSFEPSGHTSQMAALCQWLDGIPLAIELAAPHIESTADCEKLLDALRTRIDILVTTYANVDERHRSLLAIFDYSWAQLEPAQQHLMLCLTVFAGGFDEAAAVTVTGHAPATLQQLLQVAMVSAIDHGRYVVPTSLQVYLQGKSFSGNGRVLTSHSQFYAELAASLDLEGATAAADLPRFERDLSNIIMGFQVAVRQGHFERMNLFIDNLFLFFEIRGRYEEGAALFTHASQELRKQEPMQPNALLTYSRLMGRLGVMNRQMGHTEQSIEQLELGLGIQESISAWPDLTWTLNQLGVAVASRGKIDQATQYFSQSLSLAENNQDDLQIARAAANLGIVALRRNDFAEAEAHQRRSHAIYEALGNVRLVAYTLNNLGNIYYMQEKFDRAVFHYMKSAEQKDLLGDRWGVVCSLINMGRVELAQQAPDNALDTFQKCLAISQDLGKRSGIAQSHDQLARAYHALGEADTSLYHHLQAATHELALGNFVRLSQILHTIGTMMVERGQPENALHIWTSVAHDQRFADSTRDEARAQLRAHQHKPSTIYTLQDLLLMLEVREPAR